MLTLSSLSLRVFDAARLYTFESKAGISGRLPATGILRTIPGRRTVPFARGMTGSVAALIGAMSISHLEFEVLDAAVNVQNCIASRGVVDVDRVHMLIRSRMRRNRVANKQIPSFADPAEAQHRTIKDYNHSGRI